MKNFLQPTKVTWIVFGVLMVIFAPLFLLGFFDSFFDWQPVSIPDLIAPSLFAIYAVTVFLVFMFYDGVGLPVGGYAREYFRFPNPNLFGWILIGLTNIIVYYLLASIVSRIWYAVKKRM